MLINSWISSPYVQIQLLVKILQLTEDDALSKSIHLQLFQTSGGLAM